MIIYVRLILASSVMLSVSLQFPVSKQKAPINRKEPGKKYTRANKSVQSFMAKTGLYYCAREVDGHSGPYAQDPPTTKGGDHHWWT